MVPEQRDRRSTYRAFPINGFGRIGSLPEIIVAADDGDALLQAEQLVRSQPIELWEGGRLVARLPLFRAPAALTGPTGDRHPRN